MKAFILLSIAALPTMGNLTGKQIFTQAFQEKNACLLEAWMGQEVVVSFFENEVEACPAVATEAIQRFLDSNKGSQFKFRHEGASKGGKCGFWMGDLNTKNGVLRVVVDFKKMPSGISIIRITVDSPGMSEATVNRLSKAFHFTTIRA